MNYNIGVDIGGTFTDCVVVDEGGALTIGKALSTPDNFANGVVNAVRDAAQNLGMAEEALLASTNLFFHGTTVGDNTLLTRSGAKTGLITTWATVSAVTSWFPTTPNSGERRCPNSICAGSVHSCPGRSDATFC